MNSVLLTLQTNMIRVMNGINQLNLIITKIKQYNSNNMINNMMNNFKNMALGMNNMMGMQGMNMLMQMNEMMNNMNFGMNNFNLEDIERWNLTFENQEDNSSIYIRISE